MNESIDEMAGTIWNTLEQNGPVTVAGPAKKFKSNTPQEISMAAGWLAREDKIEMKKNGKSIKVSLQ